MWFWKMSDFVAFGTVLSGQVRSLCLHLLIRWHILCNALFES